VVALQKRDGFPLRNLLAVVKPKSVIVVGGGIAGLGVARGLVAAASPSP